MSDYGDLVAELATTVTRRDTDLAGAERAYHEGMAAAAAELRHAEAEAHETDRRAAAAAAAVVEVDRDAELLWSDLHRTRAWLGQRPGPAPDPAPATAQPRLDLADDASATLLAEAAHRIHGSTRRATTQPNAKPPVLITPLLPLLGAATTGITTVLATALAALATLDLPAAGFLRTLAWLIYFASPFAGIPVATHLLRHRCSTRIDTGGVVLTVLGGLGALSTMIITFS
ncbi:hypothetical protein [Asanoa sp. NPDC050611]|uniref:hypothetical protein n=1 Tax=Asanoa sp. NPDC050611 TaxID=3157098 RepID=UPI0034051603